MHVHASRATKTREIVLAGHKDVLTRAAYAQNDALAKKPRRANLQKKGEAIAPVHYVRRPCTTEDKPIVDIVSWRGSHSSLDKAAQEEARGRHRQLKIQHLQDLLLHI